MSYVCLDVLTSWYEADVLDNEGEPTEQTTTSYGGGRCPQLAADYDGQIDVCQDITGQSADCVLPEPNALVVRVYYGAATADTIEADGLVLRRATVAAIGDVPTDWDVVQLERLKGNDTSELVKRLKALGAPPGIRNMPEHARARAVTRWCKALPRRGNAKR